MKRFHQSSANSSFEGNGRRMKMSYIDGPCVSRSERALQGVCPGNDREQYFRWWIEKHSWTCHDWSVNDHKKKFKITSEVYCDGFEDGNCNNQLPLFVLKGSFIEDQQFIYKMDPGKLIQNYGIRTNDRIWSINGMLVTGCDPGYVVQLLKFFVSKRRTFTLILERKPSEAAGKHVILDVTFTWNQKDVICIVEENKKGRNFSKDLETVNIKKSSQCFLMHVESELCVATDGKHISLQKMADKKHCTSTSEIWQYSGEENDRTSRYWEKGRLTVFSFKLKSINFDLSKCLGIADKQAVTLLQADIPDHGFLKTKTDGRFFYSKSIRGHQVFESTQFERHYLAVVKDTSGRVLRLKYKSSDHSDDELVVDSEIVFHCWSIPNELA